MTLQYLDIDSDDKDKKLLLDLVPTQELSEVEKRYSLNALRIFKERYLLKSDNGVIVERLDDLFRRVAVAAGIMEVLYDKEFYNKDGSPEIDYEGYKYVESFGENIEKMLSDLQHKNSNIDYANINDNIHIYGSEFLLNPFHKERLLARYIELYGEGKVKEPFWRILDRIEHSHDFNEKYILLIQKYYDLMANGIFLPNTPTLMNAGTKLGQNAACFTLRMEDSIDGIGKTCADVMKIFKSGGGIGINYSELRHKGAFVRSTGGVSSGAISFLKIVDAITGTVAQAGKRRGASMGILNIDHADIAEFITLKDNKTLHNHNISICANDGFFNAFMEGNVYTHDLMKMITDNAWKTGDPGMVFLENMNKNNLLKPVFKNDIDVTNPCSEIAMYPYESCILASINLTKFVNEGENRFDIEEFINVTRTVTQFLDGIIDATKYPIEEINKMTKDCRRIGVGYMGLADVMTMLGIQYNSEEGFLFCEYITALMTVASLLESQKQAVSKGPFPLWNHEGYKDNRANLPINAIVDSSSGSLKDNIHKVEKYFSYRFTDNQNLFSIIQDAVVLTYNLNGFRNCSTTTVAPTGTLSMFVDCSSGIEPNFSNAFTKKVTIGDFHYVNKYLKKAMDDKGIWSRELAEMVADNNGSVQDIKEIPEDIQKVFVTAMDIHPFDHIMMQSRAQRWITNGIAKTINAPHDITPALIEYCYVLAWKLGNKGITVYRDKCKDIQVLNNSGTVKDSKLETSYYTYNYIGTELDLPNDYAGEILDACNIGGEGGEKCFTIPYSSINMMGTFTSATATSDITSLIWTVSCSNCATTNTLMRNGSNSCFICSKCGNSIGSCA